MKEKPVHLLSVLLLCVVLAGCATAGKTGSAAGELLEGDPALISGTLENGLSYRILRHRYPENRISLRLVVKAGSVLEGAKRPLWGWLSAVYHADPLPARTLCLPVQ
ncbi:MAG: hypothetical protein LBU25_00890 [Treponema sp.]|jgi:predicted small secreted protein|nr:hypothetical protein [Treponema sp.]